MRIAACLILITAMLSHPQPCAKAARDALSVWGLHVVPSLFPYMVFARLLAGQLKAARLSPCAVVPALGLLGGSPSGASVLAGYAARLPRGRLLSLCALTGTISPMFILGTLASWGMPQNLCRALLASHGLSACLCAFIVSLITAHDSSSVPCPAQAEAHGSVISQCVQAILGVGGCIVFFSVAAALMELLLPSLGPSLRAPMHAVLEIAGGMHALIAQYGGSPALPVLCAALLGFGGLSVMAQNVLFLRPLGIGYARLVLFALLRAAFSAGFMAILSLFMA